MSLRLLMDEDSQARRLVELLRIASHDVLTNNEAGLNGKSDSSVLDYARRENRIMVTKNCKDFVDLHQDNPNHPGILLIYENKDYSKNQSRNDIVRAIANLEAEKISLANQLIALNQWNY